MVVGRNSDKEHQRPSLSSEGARIPRPGSATGSVSAIRSTSFFDSPHFSRQHPYKSMPVPVSSEAASTSSENGEGAPRGYRPPPMGYGAHYPFGYPPGHPYGPPPPGYSPHHGGPPPPGYPHHHYSSPHGYHGRSLYGYGGGYDGSATPPPGYPMQHSREGQSKIKRGPAPSSGDSVRSAASGSQRASPVGGARREGNAKASPEQAAASPPPQEPSPPQAREPSPPTLLNNNPRASPSTKIVDEVETERLRQAAMEEISASQVEPIKTAFHFFVMDMRESLRPLAEAEVRRSINAAEGEPLDPYLVNSNMNCRLMKAWEDLNEESRQGCMRKEEEDRRRFMEEEEIASRHCATLTARSKSPKTPERRSSNLTACSSDPHNRATPSASPTSMVTAANPEPSPSPSHITRLAVAKSASHDSDEKKMDDPVVTDAHSGPAPSPIKSGPRKEDGGLGEGRLLSPNPPESAEELGTKRPSPSKQEELGGSPPKRNRTEEEAKKDASLEKSEPTA